MDFERFPESESAKRLLSYVTQGWYDRSYVGKWLYEVIGRELDLSEAYLQELADQFFVDTATWGLMYHEKKYGLPVRVDLSDASRRVLIKEKRDMKYPMSPYHMERLLRERFEVETHIYDENDRGSFSFSHPNIFQVEMVQSGEEQMLDIAAVRKQIDRFKLSHTLYEFLYTYCIRAAARVSYQVALAFYMELPRISLPYEEALCFFWDLRDASVGLEPSLTLGMGSALEGKGEPEAQFFYGAKAKQSPQVDELKMEMDMPCVPKADASLRIVRNEWYLNGEYRLDGERILNAEDYVVDLASQ